MQWQKISCRILSGFLILDDVSIVNFVVVLYSNFDDIYNVKHFIATLEGVVRIMGRLPEELQGANRTTLTVPYSITRTFIEETIRPVFERSMILVVKKFVLDTPDTKRKEDVKELNAIWCLVMHRSLLFLPQIEKLGNRLKNRMREAAQSTGGRFIAVDYRIDMLREEPCRKGTPTTPHATKLCPSPRDLGMWLQKHGYAPDTAIYLTQSRLDESLDPLLSFFPNVITKVLTLLWFLVLPSLPKFQLYKLDRCSWHPFKPSIAFLSMYKELALSILASRICPRIKVCDYIHDYQANSSGKLYQ